jgi:hypothetical protein
LGCIFLSLWPFWPFFLVLFLFLAGRSTWVGLVLLDRAPGGPVDLNGEAGCERRGEGTGRSIILVDGFVFKPLTSWPVDYSGSEPIYQPVDEVG